MTDAAPHPDPPESVVPPETPADSAEQNTLAQTDVDAVISPLPGAGPTPAVQRPATVPESAPPAAGSNAIAQTEVDALAAEMEAAFEQAPSGAPAAAGAPDAPVAAPAEHAAPFEAPELHEAEAADATSIDMLDDVQLDVKIELGRTHMYIEDVLKLGAGSVVELDKLAGDPVDIYVNERLIARGEVLVLNDNFCVRINAIHNPVSELEHA